MPIHQFEQDVEPFLGRQTTIEVVLGLFGILKTAEYLKDSRHAPDFTTLAAGSTTIFLPSPIESVSHNLIVPT